MPHDLLQEKQSENLRAEARALGSFSVGVVQAFMAWPGDKYKNRVQYMLGLPVPYNPPSLKVKILENVICSNYANLRPIQKMVECYKGCSGYVFYKITNSFIRYGLQDPANEFVLQTPLFQSVAKQIGSKNAEKLSSFSAGATFGMAETVFLPIDIAKLRCQTGGIKMREALRQGYKEGLAAQYVGWRDTLSRNGVGSGSLFLVKTAAYQLMGINEHRRPTSLQILAASTAAHIVMIAASHPFDVTKVQIQQNPSLKGGMFFRMKSIVQQKGLPALFQGVTPKWLNSGIKGTFAMTFCEWWVRQLDDYIKQQAMENDRPVRNVGLRL